MPALSSPENALPGKAVPESGKANEHLANERTFLAWVRTCIAIISLGFVVAKFGVWLEEIARQTGRGGPVPAHGRSPFIGAGMMIAGALLVPLAAWHHHCVSRDIEAGKVAPSYRLVMLVSALILLLTAVLVGYLLFSTDGR